MVDEISLLFQNCVMVIVESECKAGHVFLRHSCRARRSESILKCQSRVQHIHRLEVLMER
jgi:hypothetical protein